MKLKISFLTLALLFFITASAQQKNKGSITAYPSYDDYEALMMGYAQNYPDICRLDTFGVLPSGRSLLMLVIDDNPDSTQQEPVFFYTATMHGDETGGYGLMLNLVDTLLASYGLNPELSNLVDNVKICINPLANPDGTYTNDNQTVGGATRVNANGVDINRNFPDPEDGQHPDGNNWQPETQAFMALADSMGFHISANLHSGAEVVNYPWDTWSNAPADEAWWLLVGNEYADTAQTHGPAGYMSSFQFPDGVTKGYDWYSISGGRQDYMNYFHHCREMTLEIDDIKLRPGSMIPQLWEANKRSLLNYIKQAEYGVSGVVSDSVSGKPLKTKVFSLNHDVDSSHVYSRLVDGYYHRYLAAGNYTLKFSAPGYVSKQFQIVVNNYQHQVLNVELAPANISVAKKVVYDVRIYPNPVTDFLRLEGLSSNTQLKLFDMNGRLLRNYSLSSATASLNMQELAAGMYILHLDSDHYNIRRKIIRQ